MRKVIDLECDLPPDENGNPRKLEVGHAPAGIWRPRAARPLAGPWVLELRAHLHTTHRGRRCRPDRPEETRHVDGRFRRQMDRAGVEVGVLRAGNAIIADVLAQYPKRFIGLATISPHDGMRGVRELVRLVKEHGFGALRVSSLYNMVPASDRRYYPLYAKCVELDIPVRIYTNMNYATDRPYDLGHPRHLDQIAMDFPELRIVAGLSGWPWVNETGRLAAPPSEPVLRHRIASSALLWCAGIGLGAVPAIRQYAAAGQDHGRPVVGGVRSADGSAGRGIRALPLKDAVIDKWLYRNAQRFFRLG